MGGVQGAPRSSCAPRHHPVRQSPSDRALRSVSARSYCACGAERRGKRQTPRPEHADSSCNAGCTGACTVLVPGGCGGRQTGLIQTSTSQMRGAAVGGRGAAEAHRPSTFSPQVFTVASSAPHSTSWLATESPQQRKDRRQTARQPDSQRQRPPSPGRHQRSAYQYAIARRVGQNRILSVVIQIA